MGTPGFFSELKRRHIYRGGVMYAVSGWVVVEVTTTLFPIFGIPEWAMRLVIVVIMVGFPLALIGLWMFESTVKPTDEPATPPEATYARSATSAHAEGGERRRGADRGSDRNSEALAKLMEEERLERQRSNEQLLAALGEIKGSKNDAAPASIPVSIPTTVTPMPAYYPIQPAKKRGSRKGMLLLGLVVLILASWGIWTYMSPSINAETIGNTGKVTQQYVLPVYNQVKQAGGALLKPVLNKLGIHIAPARAFSWIMMVLALLVLRNFYFKMADARRRARRVDGR